MTTRKKKTAVSDEAVMEAIRDVLEDGDPRTAGLAEQLANGYVDLLDGLPFGESREYRVTFRELTAKDSIDAETEAERLMETRNGGPVLIARRHCAALHCCAVRLPLLARLRGHCLRVRSDSSASAISPV